MTHDPLKALLMEVEPAPARDLSFVVAVMRRVEQRRLMNNLAWLGAGTLAVTALLFLIMPHVEPALTQLGELAWPAVVLLAVGGFSALGLEQARRVFREAGFRL